MLAPATAERIRAAVAEIAYVPNLLAGGLASSRSRLVAVLVPDIANSIFNDTIEAMVDALAADGYMPMLGLTRADDSRTGSLIEAAVSRRVDGIILTGGIVDDTIREQLRTSGATVIETWGLPPDPVDIAVGFSHRAVGAELADFLAERGYERPHVVVADGDRARARRDGFRDRWTALGGAEPTETPVPIPSRFSHGRLVFRRIADMAVRADVVLCGSDVIGQAVIAEALAAGLKVPTDLAVVGFGNLAPSGAMRPTMTTVDIDGARIGREAVGVLRRRAAGETIVNRHIDVGFRIIARESA